MAQVTFSVQMEENLKRQFDGLCQEFGMNTTTAINVFARAVVRERRIPFGNRFVGCDARWRDADFQRASQRGERKWCN